MFIGACLAIVMCALALYIVIVHANPLPQKHAKTTRSEFVTYYDSRQQKI